MKAEERFNKIVDRYKLAFLQVNKFPPYAVYYENGWVYIQPREISRAYKQRVTMFKEMTETLESRTL